MGSRGNWAREKGVRRPHDAGPMPPPLPGWTRISYSTRSEPIIAAVVVIVVVAVALRWILPDTGGRGDRRAHPDTGPAALGRSERGSERVAALEAQVSHLQGQVSELAERIDFAERLLAERRERKLARDSDAQSPHRGPTWESLTVSRR